MLITATQAKSELARRELERRAAQEHPANLLRHVAMPDERTAEDFTFQLHDPESGWYWQRGLLDSWLEGNRSIVLKARQLGVTWLAGGFGLWTALYKPGSLVLVYRQKEDDAAKIVGRVWDMLESLPAHLRNGVEVIYPARGSRPNLRIELRFPNGRISRIRGMSSAESAGHGETAAVVIMDEFAHIDKAGILMKAVQPAAGSKGKILIVSTANGRHNELTGEGNHFSWLWTNARDAGFEKKFLPWSLHPDRDQHWYDHDPEIRGLKSYERAEQYPANEHEAFTFTNRVFFDRDALDWYASEAALRPLYRVKWERTAPNQARPRKDERGPLAIYQKPEEGHDYAIGVDVATGKGRDFSAAYVIDLGTMALVAEYHKKIDADIYSNDLHFLGRYYNTARIAVEMGGGYGEPVVIFLKDGKDGRPPYPRLYRHTYHDRSDMPTKKDYGFPMTPKTRPLVIEGLERSVREHSLPWLTVDLLHEMTTFVEQDTLPSPRAQDGTNDDRVFAAAIAVEMYRQFGNHPNRPRKKPKKPLPMYPWQTR